MSNTVDTVNVVDLDGEYTDEQRTTYASSIFNWLEQRLDSWRIPMLVRERAASMLLCFYWERLRFTPQQAEEALRWTIKLYEGLCESAKKPS